MTRTRTRKHWDDEIAAAKKREKTLKPWGDQQPKRAKYGNQRTEADGITFHSKWEARAYRARTKGVS